MRRFLVYRRLGLWPSVISTIWLPNDSSNFHNRWRQFPTSGRSAQVEQGDLHSVHPVSVWLAPHSVMDFGKTSGSRSGETSSSSMASLMVLDFPPFRVLPASRSYSRNREGPGLPLDGKFPAINETQQRTLRRRQQSAAPWLARGATGPPGIAVTRFAMPRRRANAQASPCLRRRAIRRDGNW